MPQSSQLSFESRIMSVMVLPWLHSRAVTVRRVCPACRPGPVPKYPSGQRLHASFAELLNLPAGHSLHAASPSCAANPDGHLEHVSPSRMEPGLQKMHFLAATPPETFSAGQTLQKRDPSSSSYRPKSHGRQAVASALPIEGLYVPAPHLRHSSSLSLPSPLLLMHTSCSVIDASSL